jgi:tRNA(Ile)-lysidine synthase
MDQTIINKSIEFIEKHKLIAEDEKILLAVSGGIDSVAMTCLFQHMGIDYAIAHCNFQLRGTESDGDQAFVKNLATSFNKEFYTTNFNTSDYAVSKNISIQMAARELRYDWFEKISNENCFHKIAIAHNRDDVVETFLINLIRGTGLHGLTGIKPALGKVIRPLLCVSRAEIADFISTEKIEFREDSSNKDVKYQRNLIRHKIIPLFKELNPSFTDTIINETEIFASANNIYQTELEKIRKAIAVKENEQIVLSIPKILSLRLTVPLLYDLLKDYDFSYGVVNDIFNSIKSQPGKIFYSAEYLLLKNRKTLIIEAKKNATPEEAFSINEECIEIEYPVRLTFERVKYDISFILPRTRESVALDFTKLNFPLVIRRWRMGDYFYPLGMKGHKKLSDYFTNQKIDLFEKEKIWLLMSGEDIIWIIGWQIDDRYKVTDQTAEILLINFKR